MKVIKLAQPGFDVKTAGDENLIYNSNWPNLKIFDQGSFTTNSGASTPQLIKNHNLGYPPLIWYTSNDPINYHSKLSGDTATGPAVDRSEFLGPTSWFPVVTKDKLIYNAGPGGVNSLDTHFYYYIFALDISKNYIAPIIKTGAIGGAHDSRIKFKIAKPTKNIDSPNLEDYVIHSDARSPLLHSVQVATIGDDSNSVGGVGLTVFHNLGYIPIFFAFRHYKDDSFFTPGNGTGEMWNPVITGTTGGSIFDVDEKKITFSFPVRGVEYSIVILKDPFLVDYSSQVTI